MDFNETSNDPGLAEPVHDAQSVFSAVMRAMSRPGSVQNVEIPFEAPVPLSGTTGLVLLTLADFDTSIRLGGNLESETVSRWLVFHTGARLATEWASADFCVVDGFENAPSLADLKQGTPEYPDRSATLIVQVEGLAEEAGSTLQGPGIRETQAFSASGMNDRFISEWSLNRGRFPLGVDVILCAPNSIAALPRTVNFREAA